MDKQAEYVLRTVEERGIRFMRLWFTDVQGFLKSVSISPAELEVALLTQERRAELVDILGEIHSLVNSEGDARAAVVDSEPVGGSKPGNTVHSAERATNRNRVPRKSRYAYDFPN